MMTWRMWRALQTPLIKYPLYWQLAQRPLLDSKRLQRGLTLIALAAVIGVVLLPFQMFSLIFSAISYSVLLMPVVLVAVLFSANWFGMRWVVAISQTISRERERGLYELVSLSPSGALGASWAVVSRCLHGNRSLYKLRSQLLLAVLVLSPVPISVWCTIVLSSEPEMLTQKVVASVSLVALLAAFYLDYIQSVVVSSLVGMLAATQTSSRFDALSWGLVGFLLLQVGTYLAVLLVVFVFLPLLYTALRLVGWLVDLSLPISALLLFYTLREAIIMGLWRALTERLNTDVTELNRIATGAL